MKTSSVAQTALLLALTAATGSATRETISIVHFGVDFKIDWWDDDRDQPYRISFTESGTHSNYTFDEDGELSIITVAGEQFDFRSSTDAPEDTSDTGSRKLLAMQEDQEDEQMELDRHHSRRLYTCYYCELTWDTMCDVGLPNVCAVVDELTGDAQAAVALMCNKFGNECNAASAEEICDPICEETHVF